jgi:hypothetical protein
VTLIEWIAAMEPSIRDDLSAIHLERLTDGTWQARASISLLVAGGRVAQTEHATITFDDRDLPDGVSAASWTRLPDRRVVLDTDIEAQLAALRASGLLGPLHWTRFGPVRGGPCDGRCTVVVKPLRYPASSVLGRRRRDHRGDRP